MRRLGLTLCVLFAFPLLARVAGTYPPGTLQFFGPEVRDAVAAPDGGVWVLTRAGLVKYTTAGAGSVFPVPGSGTPQRVALAPDGSIWVSRDDAVSRLSAGGAVLETYSFKTLALAVAPDGVLWYVDWTSHQVGRIVGGVPALVPTSPTDAWSLAFAPNGDVWILSFGTDPSNLYRMTPTGVLTTTPLSGRVLGGELQTLPNGTLLIGRGVIHGIFRLAPGGQTMDAAPLIGTHYAAEPGGNVWTGGSERFGYMTWGPERDVYAILPHDARQQCERDGQDYQPLAVDSAGGVWVKVAVDPFPTMRLNPCPGPDPVFPSLIRIDPVQFLAAHPAPAEHVPALSPTMLVMLGLALAGAAFWHMRP